MLVTDSFEEGSNEGMEPLASDFVEVFRSPHPETVYAYSPGIARLPGGRLVVTMDLGGPGVERRLEGVKGKKKGRDRSWQGKIFTSDDGGETWDHRANYPFLHARPFLAGDSLYVLGQADDLKVIRSQDDGESWTEPRKLTEGQSWHQAPSNVHYANGCVYLVMERRVYTDVQGWNVNGTAPVLMRGDVEKDLCERENWTFASELPFREAVEVDQLDYFGVPFFSMEPKKGIEVAPGRGMAPIGWLETNVVQFRDSDHYWYDPQGKTFHLWMRAHTGGTGYAAIAKVVEQEPGAGEMTTKLEKVPSGKRILYVPCPGGQMKFHILYDEKSRLFWLLSSQATDSMTKAEELPSDRYGLPNNERHRLQLHFSKNCIDWCFAGLVDKGDSPGESRHYASMVIDGEDLHILSRSGDEEAKNAHDTNFISFHTVEDFRELVY